jgi:hypothetical protein
MSTNFVLIDDPIDLPDCKTPPKKHVGLINTTSCDGYCLTIARRKVDQISLIAGSRYTREEYKVDCYAGATMIQMATSRRATTRKRAASGIGGTRAKARTRKQLRHLLPYLRRRRRIKKQTESRDLDLLPPTPSLRRAVPRRRAKTSPAARTLRKDSCEPCQGIPHRHQLCVCHIKGLIVLSYS